MIYERALASDSLNDLIDCYWVVENEDTEIFPQKIIPDGYPEIIFHYGDAYRINISGTWEMQSKKLLAGQISNHFMLENTGASGMFGIKFKPYALSRLFGIDMSLFTDKVVDLDTVLADEFSELGNSLLEDHSFEEKIRMSNEFFTDLKLPPDEQDKAVQEIVEHIIQENGLKSVSELSASLDIHERKLGRIFNRYIGVSPKFYSRIVRFAYIFSVVQEKKMTWGEIAQMSGFFDQSHFIKNFREFTGEEPSKYIFDDKNMANFFMNRP